MTAVVVMAPSSSMTLALFVLLGGIAITLALWALLAHLSRLKRVIATALLLVLLVLAGASLVAEEFVFVNPCKKYTPADWQYYVEGCFWP